MSADVAAQIREIKETLRASGWVHIGNKFVSPDGKERVCISYAHCEGTIAVEDAGDMVRPTWEPAKIYRGAAPLVWVRENLGNIKYLT